LKAADKLGDAVLVEVAQMVAVEVSIHHAIVAVAKATHGFRACMTAKIGEDLLLETPFVFAELDGAENNFDKLLGLSRTVIAEIHFEKVLWPLNW